MTDLSSLIKRLEEAEGPNYAIEVDIFKFFNPEYRDYVQGRGGLVHRDDGSDQRVLSNVRPPNVTASVDASISLAERVLPGEPILMGLRQSQDTKPWARVGTWNRAEKRGGADSTAPNLAMAIVLDTLRAIQSKGEQT